jgi:hypothetical protein
MSRFQVPQDKRRACLCRDGGYSTKCCNADDYFAQGIGSIHMGETDSAGTIIEIDTEETISSTSITPTSQGSSTVIETDTTQTYTSTSSDAQDQDTTPPVITIIGSQTINLTQGDSYTDQGATATDDIDGDLTSSITTTGTVNTSTASTYTITYSVSDAAGNTATSTRTVIVNAIIDTTQPVITIIGSSTINLTVGDSYTEAGATATDDIDGDLTSSISTSGTVDTSTASTYTITYSVSDSSGNSASETRSVIVSEALNQTPGTVTSDTWHFLNYLAERSTNVRFYATLTYGGNSYNGFTYNLSDFTDPTGIDPTSAATWNLKIDTNSVDVGTFIADHNGVLLDSADNHEIFDSYNVYRFPPFAAFATPVYMKIASSPVQFLSNPYNPYPIYKLEQVNGYIQITQIITS